MNGMRRVLLVGGSGFLGNEMGIELVQAGYQVNLLTRSPKKEGWLSYPATQYVWNADGSIPVEATEGVLAVINLAGESISEGRWSAEKKRKIVASRVSSTSRVIEAINQNRISTLIQASAIGFYGETGASCADESTTAGNGFLAETAVQWEKPLEKLDSSVRQVTMRIGVVMGTTGGALQEILNPYVVGMGAVISNGRHFMSWIHVRDLCRFVIHALGHESTRGVFNLTAPEPVSYQNMHAILAEKFGGLPWVRIPRTLLKLVLGEKSQLLLMSQKVISKRLEKIGFEFQYENFKSCLEGLLGHSNPGCAVLHVKQWIPAGRAKVWEFFSSEKNLERLTPPFLHFKVESLSTPQVQENSLISYRLKVHGFPIKWRSKIINYDRENSFQDIQLSGPYHTWQHTHNFNPLGEGTLIEDFIKYKVPLGTLGGIFAFPLVKRDIGKIFQFRRDKVAEIFSTREG